MDMSQFMTRTTITLREPTPSPDIDLRSLLAKLPSVINSITLTSVGDLYEPVVVNGLLKCNIDALELSQKPDQSDEDFFELLQQSVFKDQNIVKMEFLQSSNGWYQRIPIGYKFPNVKLFVLNGPAHPTHPKEHSAQLFQGLKADEVMSNVGNHKILDWSPFRNAQSLKIEFFCARQRGIDALKQCSASHWEIYGFDSSQEGIQWIFQKLASGTMKNGTKYQETRKGSHCDSFLKSILTNYPSIVTIKEDGKPNKYVLDLENGSRLVAFVEKKWNSKSLNMLQKEEGLNLLELASGITLAKWLTEKQGDVKELILKIVANSAAL